MSELRLQLLNIAKRFEQGGVVGGFAQRIEAERLLFILASEYSRRVWHRELQGFNGLELEAYRALAAQRRADKMNVDQDIFVAFELKQQLYLLSLSEPYRFGPLEHSDSQSGGVFGRQLRKWVERVA